MIRGGSLREDGPAAGGRSQTAVPGPGRSGGRASCRPAGPGGPGGAAGDPESASAVALKQVATRRRGSRRGRGGTASLSNDESVPAA